MMRSIQIVVNTCNLSLAKKKFFFFLVKTKVCKWISVSLVPKTIKPL